MSQLKIRKDVDEGIVEVNTGDGWRGIAPDAARDMADSYASAVNSGDLPDDAGTQQFITKLRQYADGLGDE